MDISESSSYAVGNNVKVYPLAKRQPTSVGNSKWSSSQWTSISSRSTSSPGAFFSNTLESDGLQNNSEISKQLEKLRVVSFPEYICAPQRIQSEIDLHAGEGEGTSSDEYTSFSISSDSIEFTLNSDLHTTAFPNIIVSNTTRNNKKDTTLSGDAGKSMIKTQEDKRNDVGFFSDWLTWTTSPPRPIPALHGPASLPYARCPSGAEGTVIEEPSLLPHVIWGLEPDDTFGFQYSQNVRRKYNNRHSNYRDRIYATSIPDQKATKTVHKKYSTPDDFIYLSPPLFDSPLTYLNVSNSQEGHGNIYRETLPLMDPTAQNHLVFTQNAFSPQTTGLGFIAYNNPSSVELSHLKEQPSLSPYSQSYLPTPPNSSSPQWSATFSPPTYSSFLIPLSTYDTSDFQTVADYIPISREDTRDEQRLETFNTQSPDQRTRKTAGKRNYKRRGILKTVVEESPSRPLTLLANDDDSSKHNLIEDDQQQTQSAQEYFTSEEEKPVVSLPERAKFRREQTSFKYLKLNPLYHTVHPNKLMTRKQSKY